MRVATFAGIAGLIAAVTAARAHAGDNDFHLSRLATVRTDASGDPIAVVPQNLDFRSMVSELGVVLAPRLLAPSDTLGFGGFQFSVDLGYSSFSQDADYWRAKAGASGDNMPTLGLFARKGMWFPVPSSEVGAGFVHLMDSDLWTGQAYAKIGVHEGYHDLPIPSVAVRGGVSRLMGSKELDLTVASFDLSISKQVGVGGTWTWSPYGGWNVLVIVPRSEVIDATPHVDPLDDPDDTTMNFVFKDQDDIIRHRAFGGMKLQYYVFEITLEAAFALAGSSVDDRPSTDEPCLPMSMTTVCDATDQAQAQATYSASFGLDF